MQTCWCCYSRSNTCVVVNLCLVPFAGTYQHWAAELKARLGPGSLVQLLTVGDKRLMRAEYLVSIKAQHKQSMLYTVQVQSDQAFNQKFPGFEQWYRERKQQSKHEK